jgi:enoyl-CoA hydratase
MREAVLRYEDFQFIRFEHREDGVLLAVLNRPEVMNATNARLHWELSRLWPVVQDDPQIKVVVVTGAGDRAFSAGGDLDWVAGLVGNPEAVAEVMTEVRDLVYNMIACDKPIISAINGVSVGAGLAVALLADVSIIDEEAKITDGHARLGISAGDHAAIIWPLLCGMARAKYYLMTAEMISGRDAERFGLVTFAVPHAEVLERALKIAANLARGSQISIRGTKKSLNNWLRMAQPAFDNSLALEMLSFLGADAKEGLAAFKEKRKPRFPSAQLPD